jgi:hypothetical protein
VWLLLEKVVLVGIVPALVLLATNPMAFDLKQRISGAVALIAIAFFVSFSIEKHAGKPTNAEPQIVPLSEAVIEQKADRSNCSNLVAGKDAKIECSPPEEKAHDAARPKDHP